MIKLVLTFKDADRPDHEQTFEKMKEALILFVDYSELSHIKTATLMYVFLES